MEALVRKILLFLGVTGLTTLAAAGAACSSNTGNDGLGLPPRNETNDAKSDAPKTGELTDADVPQSCKDLTLKVGEPAACDQCAKTKCCDEVLACTKSADCVALQECIAPCDQSDFICIATCQEQHSKGNDLLTEVGSCARSNCKKECPSETPDGDIFADSGL